MRSSSALLLCTLLLTSCDDTEPVFGGSDVIPPDGKPPIQMAKIRMTISPSQKIGNEKRMSVTTLKRESSADG
jgi:hypothetical protein